MTDVTSARAGTFRRREMEAAEQPRLPVGFGLAIGAGASLGIWFAIAWAILKAVG